MNDRNLVGLRALLESSFPKRCRNCGRIYESVEQFLAETEDMPDGRSSLKSSMEDDGSEIVEVFRNCACGSTLMDEFNSRRDDSEQGQRRRAAFDNILVTLRRHKVPDSLARIEILNFLKRRPNHLLELLNRKTDQP
ncbi:MAG: oxidoreductase [Gammaproteobacteria bacterium]